MCVVDPFPPPDGLGGEARPAAEAFRRLPGSPRRRSHDPFGDDAGIDRPSRHPRDIGLSALVERAVEVGLDRAVRHRVTVAEQKKLAKQPAFGAGGPVRHTDTPLWGRRSESVIIHPNRWAGTAGADGRSFPHRFSGAPAPPRSAGEAPKGGSSRGAGENGGSHDADDLRGDPGRVRPIRCRKRRTWSSSGPAWWGSLPRTSSPEAEPGSRSSRRGGLPASSRAGTGDGFGSRGGTRPSCRSSWSRSESGADSPRRPASATSPSPSADASTSPPTPSG